jgi:phosphoglycerol geranylgeranyltransferase
VIGTIEKKLLEVKQERGCLFTVLMDPDSYSPEDFVKSGVKAQENGADCLFVGGSFMGGPNFTQMTQELKNAIDIPLVLFPGSCSHISPGPDAVLFHTLMSGRNPQYLAEEQIKGSVMVQALGIEPIPTAYLLIESGAQTAVEYISNTRPIPRDKAKITFATALASQMMGMRWVYLEGGSGAKLPVPVDHVGLVSQKTKANVIVGGGIVSPELASERALAGASMVVTGNLWEKNKDEGFMKEFAAAIHHKEK